MAVRQHVGAVDGGHDHGAELCRVRSMTVAPVALRRDQCSAWQSAFEASETTLKGGPESFLTSTARRMPAMSTSSVWSGWYPVSD
jgi:hypothetical protein